MTDLESRLARMEAIEAIRHLAYAYALAIDARDLDTLVALYVDDVRTGAGTGREALKAVFDKSLRQFTTSSHLVSNHVIEFIDANNALGLVSCRIEHEVGDAWVTMVSLYHDRYEQRGGKWYIRGRVPARLYATAQGDVPIGDTKLRWPGGTVMAGNFHGSLPSWQEFWADEIPVAGERPDVHGQFVTRLRRSRSLPPSPPYFF